MGDSGTEGVIGKRGDNGSRQNDGNQVNIHRRFKLCTRVYDAIDASISDD